MKIYGRFMLEDLSEHPCQVLDISPGDVSLRAEYAGAPGEKIIAYLDHIGRLEGVVTRTDAEDSTFAITIVATDARRTSSPRSSHGWPIGKSTGWQKIAVTSASRRATRSACFT